MQRRFSAVLSLVFLALCAGAVRAENDPLSTKRRSSLQRAHRESLPLVGRSEKSHDDAVAAEEWKQIDELRSAGRRHGRGGERGDRGGKGDGDNEGGDD